MFPVLIGTHHGPDGLSRRKLQPDDHPEPEDDFEDWIDEMNGFLHIINPTLNLPTIQPPILVYSTSTAVNLSHDSSHDSPHDSSSSQSSPPSTPPSYSIIPRSEAAQKADERVLKVQAWHETLQRPSEMSDGEYATFLRYCSDFLVSGNKLWKKDHQGRHKLVIRRFPDP